ncbi:MAG: Wzz/FepE/Etk N-terminal domain-containing protein [Betaproteobacteria bacterium]
MNTPTSAAGSAMASDLPPTTGASGLEGAEDEISLLDLALVVAENLRLLIIGPLIVGLAALGISFAVPPTFTAKVVMLPPQQQQSAAAAALQNLGALAGIAGGAAGIKSPADQYVALMQTTTVEDRLIERFKLMAVYDEKYRSDARKELEKNTRISAGKKDGLLTIEFDDHDPQRAADIANAYVEELRHITSSLAITEAQLRRAFFEKQLAQTKEKLTAAQRALQAAGITEGAIRAEPKAAAEAYARLQAEVTAGEVRLQTMRGYLAETAPEFQQTQNQLTALRSQLARREAVNTAGAQGDYVDRFREFKYQETLFELFARQYEVARIDESREGAVIQVVDAATAPERKSKPKKALIAVVATLAAGFALLLWVFVRHSLRNARQDAQSAQKLGQLGSALRRSVGRTG